MKKAAITTGAFSLGSVEESAELDSRETFIGSGVVITGDVKASGDLSVAGHIEGQIIAGGKVTIAQGGVVKGAVQADEVVVLGSIVGNVTAAASLALAASAVVRGDIAMERLVIEPGASFVGRCSMPEPSQQEIAANG
jgi:cytoskeletal protein CcmA (bactofilin family)